MLDDVETHVTVEITDGELFQAAVDILEVLAERHGPSRVVSTIQSRLNRRVVCQHWDIEERIVGGSIVDSAGKILQDQPAHSRQCQHCFISENGELAEDGSARNVFTKLSAGSGRKIRKNDLRSYKNLYTKFSG